VANTHTDFMWSKRPGTLYFQTWHGTPLKRIHRDVLWAPPGRLDRLQRDIDRWDVLLSPNRVSTPLLRGAFGYEGEVLECGYPRNDVLSGPDAPAIRARVREELGIAEHQTAVLYTPTWRDDVVFAEGGRAWALGLDPAAVAGALGADTVLLLRLHRMEGAHAPGAAHPGVRDVSGMPEISDLYLAADAMVTDYSSTMFDFAITGKPMLFYTYDLADFRDRLRGFYLDLEEEAPGPLMETEDALVEALRALGAVSDTYRRRYERFRERFCHLEDGQGAARVVDRITT
jgi:CDP-glycerol glycerophosphotransferase